MRKALIALVVASFAASPMAHANGPVIVSAKVVNIFWGPSFVVSGSADAQYAQALINYRNQLGTTREYNVLTQYCGSNGCILLSNLGAGTPDWFDTSTPPTNVTDANVQAEVNRYLASHAVDASTIYMVFIPSTSYSSSGGGTSCGGPNLQYCSYHNFFTSGGTAVKYTIQPYPGCGGCQVAGWTPAQNQEHFVHHDVINTVTDPQFTTHFDPTGAELADKCAWAPPPFLVNGFGYQYTWSNLTGTCVKIR